MWAIPPLLCDPNEILVLNCTHSSDSLVFSPAMCTGVQTFHMVILIYRKVWVSPLVLPLSISLFVCIHLGLSSLFPVIPVKDPLLSMGLNSLLTKMVFPSCSVGSCLFLTSLDPQKVSMVIKDNTLLSTPAIHQVHRKQSLPLGTFPFICRIKTPPKPCMSLTTTSSTM